MNRTRVDVDAAVTAWRDGETFTAISHRYGVTSERIRQLVAAAVPDEYKAWQAAKKARHICPDCGGRKSLYAERCMACARAAGTPGRQRFWTRDAIVDLIQAWADIYGRPPGAMEWNPPYAITHGRPDWADRFYEDGCWPHLTIVQERFGSWNAAIEAAGFTPRPIGGREDYRTRRPLAQAEAG